VILTDIGEIGVHAGSVTYRLRPSLYAMSQLGEPGEIVEVFAAVMGEVESERQAAEQFDLALRVIYACVPGDEDLSEVFGYHGDDLRYVPGIVPLDDIVPLARCLLKHGIVGALPPLPRRADDEPNYVREFVAREHVALVIAHLGMGEREAWDMTMTGLVSALRAKFPPSESQSPGARAPTKAEHEATEAWFERIEAKRRAKVGLH
jgi:hypothetical protein